MLLLFFSYTNSAKLRLQIKLSYDKIKKEQYVGGIYGRN